MLFLGPRVRRADPDRRGDRPPLTLIYWLVEALRIYDHDVGATVPALPAVIHDGPPEGVHMPGPSFRPFLGAVGATMLMLGLVFGEWLLLAGVIALVVTLVGWLVDAVKEYRKTEEADTTGHLENIPEPQTPGLLMVASRRPARRRRGHPGGVGAPA